VSLIAFTLSMGMAKPIPVASARMAVLMPITSPFSLSKGPPELPGLIAASVCKKSTRLSGIPTCAEERAKVLIIPRVTVLFKPTGLPTAIAQSPTST
jgi:hypothetical protein